MSTYKDILSKFKKEIKNAFQAPKNIVDVSEKYIAMLENAEGGSGAGGIDYSTDEQDTGLKWIDGKNIYQKTIILRENNVDKFTYNTTTSIYENCIPSGCDYIIISDFYAKRTGAQFVDYTNCSTDMNAVLYIGGNGLYFKHAVGITYIDVIITIKYTKAA